jgi:hypothetical protein
MSGGVVKLVATGDQDAWLTGKPEISFYRSSYRKYTHYANSIERQIIQGAPSAGGISTIRFEKKGDLLSYVYFTATDNNGAMITNLDWTQVFDKFELMIGGQVVDTQDIEYMTDIEPVTGAQNYSQRLLNLNSTIVNNQKATFLPLKFFFCKDWSVCLPLIALQYHDVEIRITWSTYLNNYTISYDTYSVAAPTVSNIPGAGSAVTATNPVTGTGAGTVLNNTSFLFGATTLTTDIVQSFTYTSGTAQLIPGMVFTSFSASITATVSSVTSTTSTSGTCVMFFASAPTAGAFAAVTKSPSSYATATQTGGSFAIAGSVVTATGQTVYPGVTLAGLTAANGVIVNSIVSTFTTSLGTSVVAYISAVTTYAAAGTSATVTLTLGGGTITNGVTIASTNTGVVTPNYPVVNLLVGSATGTISAGQNILGVGSGATLATQTIPSVNTVFSSTLISVNYTTPFVTATAANIDTYFASCLTAVGGLTFLPATYLAGVITQSGGTGALTTTGGTTGALSYANGTLSTAATLGGYVFQTAAMQKTAGTVLTSPYVSVSTAATSFGIQYTAANNSGTAIPQYSQFAIIPQNFTAVGQCGSPSQLVVDDASITTINLQKLVGASQTAIAVGQEIFGLSYTGPVVVSRIIATGGTFTSGTGTATLEVSFPRQSSAGSTTTGAGTVVYFIDPSLALGPGVTASPLSTGNPTYGSLQYQCWTNFVYLDQMERDWFAKSTHDLLITQVQRAVIGVNPTQELALAQPVKFIAFPAKDYDSIYSLQGGSVAANYQFKTQINGVDVGESRGLPHWVDVPHYYNTPYGYMHNNRLAGVAVISYCLDTSKLQPTGTLNFSRLDTFRIVTPPVLANGVLGLCGPVKYPTTYLYAVNYNVLRIQNGTGGLLYAS